MALIHQPEPRFGMSSSRDTVPGSPFEAEGEVDLRQLARSVFRQRWLIGTVTGLVIGSGALFTWLQTPEYEAEATIHLHDTDGRSGLLGSLGATAPFGFLAGVQSSSVSTEIALLRSRSIAEAVADSLKLRVQVLEPVRPRAELLEVLSAPQDTTSGLYELVRGEHGRYEIRAGENDPPPSPSTVSPGELFHLAGTTLRLLDLTPESPSKIEISVRPFRDAAESVRGALDVNATAGGAQVLSLRVRHRDRVLAAEIPNALARSYVEYKGRTNSLDAGSSVRFLQEQVDRYAADLAQAEERLQRFSERERIVSLPDQASAQIRHVADLEARRNILRTELEALREVLAQASVAPADPDDPSPYRRLATFPTLLSNGIVQNLVSSLTDFENERSRLLGRFTPQHPDVLGVEERIRELEAQLFRIASDYVESLETQVGSTEALLGRMSGALQAAPSRQVDYARLVREQSMLEQIYTLLETRLTEARIREAGEPVAVRLLDAALVPRDPVWPRPLLFLLVSALAGFGLAVGVASVRALFDPKVRSSEDALAAAAGSPVIVAIPRIWVARGANGRRLLGKPMEARKSGEDHQSAEPQLVTFHDPMSPAAEAYRGLRTSITLARPENPPRVMVATSPMPGEGKSITAANLAIALAQQGTRTLLIDADLRQGSQHRLFGLPAAGGLTDVLRGQVEADEAIHRVGVGLEGSSLDLLVAGSTPPNPSELLGSAAMRDFLAMAREKYEMVLLDAPPLQVVTDAAVLGTLADSTLLIARAGTTQKRALGEAAAALQRLGISLGGVVVNDADPSGLPYYTYGSA